MLQRQRRRESTSSDRAGAEQAPDQAAGAPRGNGFAAMSAEGTTGSDPRSFNDRAGNATTQAPIAAEDGFNAPDAGTPEMVDGELDVHVKHDLTDPLVMAATPSESQLYDERASTGECEAGWEHVTGRIGTVAQPSRIILPVDDSLFIGGAPSMNDVHQAGLADCYFLASIASIVQSDPGQITGMMSLSGNNVTVDLFRYDSGTATWVPVSISVTTDLAQYSDGGGGTAGLVGAGFRVGDSPKMSEWYAGVMDDKLWVSEDAHYEVGLWAPMLEKAYARYAERFGQYGGIVSGNSQTDAGGNARSGYEIINGGVAQRSYPIVYGPDVVRIGQTNMNYTPGGDLVSANLPAIQNLLRVGGDGVAAGQAFNMTVGIGRNTAIDRLDAEVTRMRAQQYIRRYPTFAQQLEYLQVRIGRWRGAATQADKDTEMGEVAKVCRALAKPGNWPVLDSDRENGEFRDLQDLLLVVMNIQTDGSSGQRLTYAWHSYSVLGADFQDAAGAPLAVTLANLATTSAQIDPAKSRVRLRNPHGTNEPDTRDTGATEGADDGEFSLQLEQFFRVFAFEQHGLVRT